MIEPDDVTVIDASPGCTVVSTRVHISYDDQRQYPAQMRGLLVAVEYGGHAADAQVQEAAQ